MKKLSFILYLSICFSALFAQNAPVASIRLADGLMCINNSEGAYYTVSVSGDSVKQTEYEGIYIVDKQIVQINSSTIPDDKLDLRFDIEQEVKLLQSTKDIELDYLKNKVFAGKDLKTEERIYINKNGKTFLFWSYEIPKSARKANSIDPKQAPVTSNLFVSCVANNKILGINLPITEKSNRKLKENYLAQIADNVVVYGDKIDVNALSYRILCKENKEKFVYVDSVNHFKVKVPEWLNITQNANPSVWGGTLYDNNNQMNGILVMPISKSKFQTISDVEKFYITGNTNGKAIQNNPKAIWLGHQSVEKPYNCNGSAFELKYSFENANYKCRYLIYETSSSYLLAMYTATEGLYDKNLADFKEFLEYLVPSLQ